VELRLRHDELGELVAEQLATAGAIILGRHCTFPGSSIFNGVGLRLVS
jgi:hypothetical protein